MGKIVLGMTMSLDGFIQDRSGSVEALYHDLDHKVKTIGETIHESALR